MSFFESLKNGTDNIQINLPSRFEIINESKLGVNLMDTENQVYCHISKSPAMLDLNENYSDLLFSDIDKIAITDFDEYFKSSNKENTNEESSTKRENWNPVITAKFIEFDNSKALYVVRRLAYQPFEEVIIGSIMIPTEDYTYEITVTVKAGTTGMRESLLVNKILSSARNEQNIEDFLKQKLPQHEIDKEEHDDLIKEHPLSLVRTELRWFLYTSGLKIKKPYRKKGKETELKDLNCAVTPPNRYLYSPSFILFMPQIRMFPRIAIYPKACNYDLGSLNVYKVPNIKIYGNQEELIKLANKILNAWKDEGVENIVIETNKLPVENKITKIDTFTKLEINGQISYNVANWIASISGEVYRIDCSFVELSEKNEKKKDLNEFVKSWRLLSDNEKNIVSNKKWWQIWQK